MISIPLLKEWLGQPEEEGITDLLTALEERAVDIVLEETERHFAVAIPLTEYVIGDGNRTLRLNENPASITSVEVRLHVGDAWTAITEGDSDGFELRAPKTSSPTGKAKLLRKDGLAWLFGYEHRVIYPFGYTAGDEPGTIRQAVFDLVSLKYYGRGREGLQAYKAGDVAWTQFSADDILAVPGLKRTLARWRGKAYA